MEIPVLLISDASVKQENSNNFEHRSSFAFYWKSKYITRYGFGIGSKKIDSTDAEATALENGITSINSFFQAVIGCLEAKDVRGFEIIVSDNPDFKWKEFLKDIKKSGCIPNLTYAIACDNFFFIQDLILFNNKRSKVIDKYIDIGDARRKTRTINDISSKARTLFAALKGQAFLYSPKEFDDEIRLMHSELDELCRFVIKGYNPDKKIVKKVIDRIGNKIEIHSKMCR